MTDDEIIKALVCCSEACCACEECPLYCCGANCSSFELHRYALDLTNRQKSEISALKTEAHNYKKIAEKQQSVSMNRYFEIKKLKDKIKRAILILEKENDKE